MRVSPSPSSRLLKCLAALGLLAAGSSASRAAATERTPFAAVFIDPRTEASRLGPFPYDRAIYARAIDVLRRSGARAVVLKYFLDQPKSQAGDEELARAMSKIPVFVQFSVAQAETKPNPLPERFFIGADSSTLAFAVSGTQGWLPLPAFAQAAVGAGSVDIGDAAHPERVPLFNRYRGRPVESLWLAVVEWARGRKTRVANGVSAALDRRILPLSEKNEATLRWPAMSAVPYFSFIDLIDGKVPSSLLRGKIVVLGYKGSQAATFKTPDGQVLGAHEVFFIELTQLYRSL